MLREAGTERPFTGEYTDTKTVGVYSCRACKHRAVPLRDQVRLPLRVALVLRPARGGPGGVHRGPLDGSVRTEVRCATCGSHLGHVFEGEGYGTPTDQRYCINSVSLKLETEGA